jgi:uncharacterized membrane protein
MSSVTLRGVPVDVHTEIEIARPRDEVAGYASDPDNAPEWYDNIESVEWRSPRPVAVGAEFAFVARFLGRTLAYTYEVMAFVPAGRLVMRTSEGPFPMETTYVWHDTLDGGTRMELRNRGEPTGFAKVGSALMTSAMRRANVKDLRRLKETLEGG